jgi:hypothetical protein
MVIPKSVHVDTLDVSTLRGPLLDDYYGSALQRRDVMAVAEEIMRRHIAKLPSNTGNLRSTARVTAHRSKEHRDRRYEAEYSVGGPRADYIVPLEDEHHYLDSVLREMGFYTGDIVDGPTGTIRAEDKAPATPQRASFRALVSGKAYNAVLSRDTSGFADEHDIADPEARRQGRGYRYDYGEISDAQARAMLRRLEHGGDSEGFDDPEAIAEARAVQREYERMRQEFDASRPDAPYVTFHQERQARNEGGQ